MHGGGRRGRGGGDRLAFQHAIADGDDGLGRVAAVLAQREHELRRHEAAANRQTAVEVDLLAGSRMPPLKCRSKT